MSNDNYIQNSINIQDFNLKIKSTDTIFINGNKTFVLYCELNNTEPITCPECGSTSYKIKDYYERKIKYVECFGLPSMIKFKQKRLMCKDCNKVFTLSSNIVQKHSNISSPLKMKILNESREKQSFKSLSKKLGISSTTSITLFSNSINVSRNPLTEVICIDEFKASTSLGKYAFILGDPLTGNILDILPSRKQEYIYSYFNNIPKEERFQVKYVISDMFESYRTVVRELFINSIHIADRFHWIRCTTESFNKLRINTMNKYLKIAEKSLDNDEARELRLYAKLMKSYYKLLLANKYRKEETYFSTELYIPSLRKHLTRQEIIEFIINSDKDLEEGYILLQSLYKISVYSSYDNFVEDINDWFIEAKNSNINEFKKTITTYKSWMKEIRNSFIIHPKTNKMLTNGYMEGKNNLCKAIKRLGFGYKDFELLRNRIMLIGNKNITIKN